MNAQPSEHQEKQEQKRQCTIALITIGFVFYLTIPLYYLKIMSLDYYALMTNLLSEPRADDPLPWYANNYFMQIGKIFLQWGGLPLFLLMVGNLGSYIDLRRGNKRYFHFLQKHKFLLITIACLTFLFFCFPFSLAFSVWISVEAFWWIQWYNNVNFLTNDLLLMLPNYLFPILYLLGMSLMFASFPSENKKKKRTSQPLVFWILRLLRVAFFVSALILVVCIGSVGILHASRINSINGPKVFTNKCAGCHDLYLPLYLVKTPNEWRRTIDNQINIEKVELTAKEKKRITQFLLGMRSFSDSWTFRTRCQRCHIVSYYQWEKRTPDDWKNIVHRIAKWSPYYYNADVREQVINFLVANFSQETNTFGLKPEVFANYQTVEKTCSQCHSLSYGAERYQNADQKVLVRMVSRMNRKMPTSIPDQEIDFFASTYRKMISDQTVFQRMLPHDRPVFQGGLPW